MSLAPAGGPTRYMPEIGPKPRMKAMLNPVMFLSQPSLSLRFPSGQRGFRTRTGTRPEPSLPGGGAKLKVIAVNESRAPARLGDPMHWQTWSGIRQIWEIHATSLPGLDERLHEYPKYDGFQCVTAKNKISPGYDQMGRGSGMKILCDATAYGSDRVCDIPKMLRHRYDSLQCSCNFPSWMGK